MTEAIAKIMQPLVARVQLVEKICDKAGGADFLLTELAAGLSRKQLAKQLQVSVMDLSGYLRGRVPPTILAEAVESSYESRLDDLEMEANDIDEDDKRVAAKFKILSYLASKDTVKYKDKQESDRVTPIQINVNWAAMDASVAPAPIILDMPVDNA